MKSLIASFGVVIVATSVVGCGDDAEDCAPGQFQPSALSCAPDPTRGSETEPGGPTDGKQAVSVSVRSGGGLSGDTERLMYAADSAPPGVSPDVVDEILAAASEPALIDAKMEKIPKNTCCDRVSTAVTVTYDDGSSRTYNTLDGVEQPDVFVDFLGLL